MTKQKQWLYACLIVLSIITGPIMKAQYCGSSSCELVCNGGFENTTTPTGPNQLSNTADWLGTGFTPDLFSTASTVASGVNAPCNNAGYQNPHSGNCYAGFLTNGFVNNGSPFAWVEGIETPLSSNLVSGVIYDVSFYISAGELNTFYNKNLIVSLDGVEVYTAPVSLLNDYTNWVLVSFPYCASGGESVLKISSKDDHTFIPATPIITGGCTYTSNPSGGTYIYIDDVSMKEAKFSVASQTVCLNTTVTSTAVPTCSLNTGNYTYSWDYGDGSTTVNTGTNNLSAHSYTSYGNYVGSVTISTGTCALTYTYGISVPNMTIAVTSNTNTICNGVTSFTAIPSPSGTYTVSWAVHDATTHTVIPTSNYTITNGTTTTPSIDFASINQNVCVVAIFTNTLGCTFRDSICLPSCCATPTNAIKYSNPTYSTPVALSGTNVVFGGVVTINSGGNLIIGNKNVVFDPNTKIIVNGTGKITITNSYLHGCNYMWDGIYLNGTGLSSINVSDIEDAQRAIVDSLGTASITLTNSYYNKNFIGIVVKATKSNTSTFAVRNNLFTCSNLPVPVSSPWMPTTPALSNASTFGAYSSASLLPPYNTVKSVCGIYLENAGHSGKTNSMITIGGSTGQENIFDKMQDGTIDITSNAFFQNNVFQNIQSTIAPSSSPNSAIFYIAGISGTYNTLIGGGTTSFKNTFTNNDYGLFSYGVSGLSVENNRFDTQTNGVYITNNCNGSTAQVAHNKFINNTVGINFDQNTKLIANIEENWMDNTSATGTYADNYAIRCSELTTATSTTNYPAYAIDNNYINGYYNGIYTSHTYRAVIDDNEVHMLPDNTLGHVQVGIGITDTDESDVNNNTVDMPNGTTSSWWHNALFTENSSEPEIHCNSTNYIGTALLAKQNNYTVPGFGIYSNTFQNADIGVWLNSSGEIGDQYYNTTTYSADNQWVSCNSDTHVSSGNTSNASFYTRNAYPYVITVAGGTNPLNGIVATGGGPGACASTSTPTLNLRVAAGQRPLLMQHAETIADNRISQKESEASSKEMARKQLFTLLTLKQINPSFDKNVAGFMAEATKGNLGKFFKVDMLINTREKADLIKAAEINNSIVAATTIETTQQQFNSLYLEYINNGNKLNRNAIADLESMAVLCPDQYGAAVYQARTLLFNTTRKKYLNACEQNGPGNQLLEKTQSMVSGSSVKLYPNPNSGSFTIETGSDKTYTMEVYNLLGEKVAENQLNNKQMLDLHYLPTATYVVKIMDGKVLIKTERISIIH